MNWMLLMIVSWIIIDDSMQCMIGTYVSNRIESSHKITTIGLTDWIVLKD